MKDIKERTGEDTKNTIFVFQLKKFFSILGLFQ